MSITITSDSEALEALGAVSEWIARQYRGTQAHVAQSEAQRTRNAEVAGSTPAVGSEMDLRREVQDELDKLPPLDKLPFGKPTRYIDQKLLRAYSLAHPRCEVEGCRRHPCPEPHHLIPRGRGRDDRHHNLLNLCPDMHAEWRPLGGHRWLAKYRDRLSPESIAKIERALRIGDGA